MSGWTVQLESGVWLADIEGDPGRTLVKANAKEFDSMSAALKELEAARKFRPFKNASVDADYF